MSPCWWQVAPFTKLLTVVATLSSRAPSFARFRTTCETVCSYAVVLWAVKERRVNRPGGQGAKPGPDKSIAGTTERVH